jgi:hypothetical protein
LTRTEAKKDFKLDDDDLNSLPCEFERRPPYRAVQLFAYGQLMNLAKRKCAKLEKELEVGGMIYHSHSGTSQTGEVMLASLRNPPKLEAWMEHMLNPQPPPLKIEGYTCPPQASTPDPEKIIWTPSRISGAVSIEDACRLYCV